MTVDVKGDRGRSLLRRFAICLMLMGAFASTALASNASAAAWKVNGAPLSGAATYSTASSTGVNLTFVLGTTPLTLTFSGVESQSSSIFNASGVASGEETLRFTGAKFQQCAVGNPGGPSGQVTTVPLRSRLSTVKGVTYEEAVPIRSTVITEIELKKGIGSCPLSGTYTVTGTIVGEASNIGNEQVTHQLTFSRSIEEAAGRGVHWGGMQTYLTGSLVQTLTGTYAGQTWSAL